MYMTIFFTAKPRKIMKPFTNTIRINKSRIPMTLVSYSQSTKTYCPSCSIYKKNNY